MIIKKIYRKSKGFRASKKELPFMVGLCGGISCGKTTVSKSLKGEFAFNSGRIFNADLQAKKALNDGKIKLNLLKKYKCLQQSNNPNEVDKELLREWVLKDSKNIETLENLIHPFVLLKAELFLKWCRRQRFKWIIWDIPLLWESDYLSFCHEIICLKVSMKNRRLRSPKKRAYKLFNLLLNRQMSNYEQQKKSDFVFNNNGNKSYIRSKIKRLWLKKGLI